MKDNELKVTSLDSLKKYARGSIVNLPPFAEGQPFVARITRPSMMALIQEGKIPNELLTTANSLFVNGAIDNKNDKALSDVFQILDSICDACFVEPTYAEIKSTGIKLTDDQYMFIFNYTQEGVKALDSFRTEPGCNKDNISK